MPVREATPDDAGAVHRVARASWHAAHDHIVGPDGVEEVLEKYYDVEGLAESIDREGRPMFVAEVDGDDGTDGNDEDAADGTIVGFAQGGPSNDGPADAVVGRIYVHPDHWGAGHGSALLDRLFDALRSRGHESVWLAVLADNEVGRSFYDDRGFAVHEERTTEFVGHEVEDVVMVREL